jgi:protein-S-isoprenylcysteine O-methyltransferase Ste14
MRSTCTAREDRILHEELEGYAEYAQKVHYRLVARYGDGE